MVGAPLHLRQGAWPRALDRLAPRDAYVAALVAQHALTVYRRFALAPEWEEFFPAMERRRDDLLATGEPGLDTFLQDYAIVGMGDRWSLVFCYGWPEPNLMAGYRAKLHGGALAREQTGAGTVDGGWLEITPDPFEGAAVPLDVPAWCVPARRYASDADLRDTMAHAPIVHLTGVACGAPPARSDEPRRRRAKAKETSARMRRGRPRRRGYRTSPAGGRPRSNLALAGG